MQKVSQLKTGSILSYAQMALSIIIGLVYTPIMIRMLGQSEYGLYNTVASTVSMLGLLSLGFGSGYIRYYAKYKKDNDQNSIAKLNGLFLIIFSIIGVVALFCGLFLSFNLEYVFSDGLTTREYEIAKVLMILLTVNLAVSFPMGVFKNIISAHERFIFLKIFGMITTVLSPLVMLPLLFLGFRSIAMVTVTVVLSISVEIICLFYAKVKLKQRFIFSGFEKGIFKSLFAYSVFIAINIIVDQINWNIDKLLLGRFKGTTAVAVYSVGYSLYNYYMSFSCAISGVFAPRVHRIVAETEDDLTLQKQKLTELFVKVGRVQFLILGLIATGLVFFGQVFIYYWAGDGYNDAYYVALLLSIPATLALTQNIGIEIQRAQNRHQFRSIVYLIMAFLNLALSIYLCQLYGAIGSAIGTAISLVVANGFIMNIYYHKRCNVDILTFWKNIFRVCLGMIFPIIVGIIINKLIVIDTVWLLLVLILLYTVVYCISMWLFGMNSYERTLVKAPLKKIFKRK